MKRKVILTLFAAAVLCACARTVSVKEIVEHPRDYAGKEVTVAGEVRDVFSLVAFKYFTINDGTGAIAVISEKPLPRQGETIKVTGRIEEAFSLGTETLTILIEEPGKKR